MGFIYAQSTSSGSGNFMPVTSLSTLSISSGSKTFAISSGAKFQIGRFYRAYSSSNPLNYMDGKCTAVTTTTVTLDIDFFNGSGSISSWLIDVSPGMCIKRLTNNFPSTVNTLAAVTDLQQDVLAGVGYRVQLLGAHTSSATTTGARLNFAFGTNPTVYHGVLSGGINSTDNNSVSSELAGAVVSNTTTLITTGLTAIGLKSYIKTDVYVKFGVNTNLTVQFASEVGATTATLLADSILLTTRMD